MESSKVPGNGGFGGPICIVSSRWRETDNILVQGFDSSDSEQITTEIADLANDEFLIEILNALCNGEEVKTRDRSQNL